MEYAVKALNDRFDSRPTSLNLFESIRVPLLVARLGETQYLDYPGQQQSVSHEGNQDH
jgi:hypothetical protein